MYAAFCYVLFWILGFFWHQKCLAHSMKLYIKAAWFEVGFEFMWLITGNFAFNWYLTQGSKRPTLAYWLLKLKQMVSWFFDLMMNLRLSRCVFFSLFGWMFFIFNLTFWFTVVLNFEKVFFYLFFMKFYELSSVLGGFYQFWQFSLILLKLLIYF